MDAVELMPHFLEKLYYRSEQHAEKLKELIIIGSPYLHLKSSGIYKVLTVGKLESNVNRMPQVVYECTRTQEVYIRPLHEFLAKFRVITESLNVNSSKSLDIHIARLTENNYYFANDKRSDRAVDFLAPDANYYVASPSLYVEPNDTNKQSYVLIHARLHEDLGTILDSFD